MRVLPWLLLGLLACAEDAPHFPAGSPPTNTPTGMSGNAPGLNRDGGMTGDGGFGDGGPMDAGGLIDAEGGGLLDGGGLMDGAPLIDGAATP